MPHSELYSTVLAAFSQAGWDYTEVEGRQVVRAGFEAHHTRVELHVQVFDALSTVSVVSESPLRSPDPLHRERVAELAMRVNQTLTLGNFEMEWDTGRLLFRISNIFPLPQGDVSLVQGMVHTTVAEMDRIAPLESIILRSKGPALAALDIPNLMNRDDFLPVVGPPLDAASR